MDCSSEESQYEFGKGRVDWEGRDGDEIVERKVN